MLHLFMPIPIVVIGGLTVLSVISQRGTPPGVQDGTLKPGSRKPNAACSEDATPPEQKVDPLKGSRDDIRRAIADTGGTITADSENYIAATYSSKLMRFVDDVEFRRDGDVWQVRSASRVGHSDMGANRKRIERLRATLSG
jgi:uncharacterized protein (DUF1499 family)